MAIGSNWIVMVPCQRGAIWPGEFVMEKFPEFGPEKVRLVRFRLWPPPVLEMVSWPVCKPEPLGKDPRLKKPAVESRGS